VGHWRRAHIAKGIVLGAAGIGLACALARGLLNRVFASGAFGVRGPSDPAAAPLLLLLFWAASLLSLPVENAVSRRFEDEADRFAVALTRDPGAAIRAEEALTRKNLGDVAPPPAIHLLFSTHPEPLDRIARAEEFARRAGETNEESAIQVKASNDGGILSILFL
jgi:STE24 endopeptidase